ncbi:MAG TPA: NAD kinase [Streptosporangiaceae bacterium]|nr:NAD kinase [Streptosporangiaceae bacterium]
MKGARLVADRLSAAGMTVRVLAPEAAELACAGGEVVPPTEEAAAGAEMVLVLGGDGTLLRAAELARPVRAPLLGVNLGHVGFLAEAEPEDLTDVVARVVDRDYAVRERMTIDVTVRRNGTVLSVTWALNEASVEKLARERMIEVVTEVDGRPLSRWAGDGVVCATPTGSTAYAFSAGGPIVWPEVEALVMVPISAHALFAGPMVVSPRSVLAVEVLGVSGRAFRDRTEQAGWGEWGEWGQRGNRDEEGEQARAQHETVAGVLWCDGRRSIDLPPGARVEVRRGAEPVLLARLTQGGGEHAGGAAFTDRLVAKFGLPVSGWRGAPARRVGGAAKNGEEPA